MNFDLKPGSFIQQVPDAVVYALTWKQPFLSLMGAPHFKKETRVWNASLRGWVLMCAGKLPYDGLIHDITGDKQYKRIVTALNIKNGIAAHFQFAHRDLLGNALYIGWLSSSEPMKKEDEDACFVKYNPNLYVHTYKHVYAIRPIEWKGKQGWKKVDEKTLSQIIIKAQ